MSSLPASLLNGGSQSLTASNVNNAAGLCLLLRQTKPASVTNTENVKNQVLDKLSLASSAGKTERGRQLSGRLQGLRAIIAVGN